MFGFIKKAWKSFSNTVRGFFGYSLNEGTTKKAMNDTNELGYSSLHSAIAYDDNNAAQNIINHPKFDLAKSDSKQSLLLECAIHSKYDVAKSLLEKGLSLDSMVAKNLTARNAFALNDDVRPFFREMGAFQSEKEMDDYIKLSRAKAILNLSYSNDSFGVRNDFYQKIIRAAVAGSDAAYSQDALAVVDLAESEGRKSMAMPNGHHLRVYDVGYKTHAAYFMVESDQSHNPVKITYCDGNNALGYDRRSDILPKAISFDIDPQKIQKFANQPHAWMQDLQQSFKDSKSQEMYDNQGQHFLKTMSKVAVCDKKGNPVITEKSIPSAGQKRGNCALKAFNILYRALVNRINPECEFGVKSGSGYDAYKTYKNSITHQPINDLLELAHEDNKGKTSHQEALTYLQETVFLKMVAKNNVQGLKELKRLFDNNGVDCSNIKHKGKSAMDIAMKYGHKETLDWLREEGKESNNPSPITSPNQVSTLASSQSQGIGA